jgi:hypothetical protein
LITAASLVVFDLLALAGRDLRGCPIASAEHGCDDSSTTPGHRCW